VDLRKEDVGSAITDVDGVHKENGRTHFDLAAFLPVDQSSLQHRQCLTFLKSFSGTIIPGIMGLDGLRCLGAFAGLLLLSPPGEADVLADFDFTTVFSAAVRSRRADRARATSELE
jgi:hypothetical protein